MAVVAELQIFNTYKKYLIWDTGWSQRHDNGKDITRETKNQSRELEVA